MKDVNHPDVTVRDIVIDEHGGETVVAEWNPAHPKQRKVLKMESEHPIDDPKKNTHEVKRASNVKSDLSMNFDDSSEESVEEHKTLKIIVEPPVPKKIQAQPITAPKVSTIGPQQLVKFYMAEAVMGVKYHEVIIKGISLVLAFDQSYEAATVPEFEITNDNKAFKIEVVGYPYILHCYYYGQHFEHNGFTYTLFAIYETEAK
jgi:hypothetical protein